MQPTPEMKEPDTIVQGRRSSSVMNRPLWMELSQDRRRYERLLGLVLWITLFAVLFDFGR